MESIVLILVFIIVGIAGFGVMKKVDLFLAESCVVQKHISEGKENVIKIACENPIMLTSVCEALDKMAEEFRETSFCFYTGGRDDIQKMIENESVDIVLLMEEMDGNINSLYGKKQSFFVPASLEEPLTGLKIEPIEHQRMMMYVLWNERHITERQSQLLFRS
ncbi:MAG: hypothetical protein SO016_08535 [Lachnospiraceae bacterium]|nr:hypothetical protein [Robinsoniella sp.]MDY3766719.1 hypothetical protein [Lachnospiraceae bacterium]